MTIPIPAVGSTGWDVSVDAVINRVNELVDLDPTSDADKPVSTAQQAALDLKLDISAAYTDEQVRDVMGTALVAGTDIAITPDDGANTITITSTAAGGPTITPLRVERTSKDAEGLWTTISWYREDDTLIQRSVLSGGTTPEYTTRTVTYYDTDGTTVLDTAVMTLSYDVDGDFEGEAW